MSRGGNSGGGGGNGCRDGAGSGGGDDGGFCLAEQPLDGLAVGAVTQLASELEYPGSTEGWHADAAAAPVDLGVTVSGARGSYLGFGSGGGGGE